MQKTLNYLKMMALGLLAAASAHAGTFSTDFSKDPSAVLNFGGSLWDGVTTTGTGSANWQTNGGAGPFGNTTSNTAVSGVEGDGFLQLTFADHNCSSNLSSGLTGGVLFDDFDSGLVVAAFTFEADFRIGNGNPSPADGFSVNYVRDNDPVLLALNAGDTFPEMNGHISPAGGQFEDNGSAGDLSLMEEGTQTGLSICFDMWDSGAITTPPNPPAVGQEVPGITHDYIGLDIRVDGLLLTTIQMPNGTTGNGGPGTTALTATDPTAIETGQYDASGCDANLSWVHLKAVLDVNGVLNVYWKNKQILTNLQTTYFPSPGRLLFASRVGGNTANIEIDNIQITTQPSPLALAGGALGFPDGFSIQVNDSGPSQFDTNKPVELTLDGTTVTATSIVKSNNLTLITYHGFPTLLTPGSSNIVTISALDTRGTNITGTSSFIAPVYSTINPSYAVTGVDTTKIGFKVRPYQTTTPNSGPSSSFAEMQQAGLEGSNTANLTQTIDGFPIDSSGSYTITDPINWADLDSSAFNGSAGSFNSGNGFSDLEFPGEPPAGTNGDQLNDEYYNLSERVTTYLYLPTPGVYQMGVDSASGFTVTSGRNPSDALAPLVGSHEGGGQNNTTFYFVATKAGYYPFGLLYYDGKDAANAEWFTVVNGVRYLINDLTSTNITGVVGYYAGPALPAYVSSVLESPLQLTIKLTDQATTVTDSSIQLSVNGATVAPTIGEVSGVTTVSYSPPTALASGSSNTFTLIYTDSSGTTTTNVESFIAPNYTAVPASIAVTGVNTSDIGFKVKAVQTANSSTTIAYAETQIAGLDGTNYADLTQTIDGFTIDSSGYYTVTNPINWDGVSVGHTDGNFNNNNGYPEIEFPGMPGSIANLYPTVSANNTYENLAEEVLTYMYFSAAGVYEMGVNSDDGFKVTTGVNPKDQLSSIDVGQFDGGRGSADTDFNILIPAPGYYPFRLLYYNGGGGANCEWFTFKNGVRYLINDPDPSNTTGIHAYYAGPSLPPYVAGVHNTPTNVVFDLAQSPDGGTATVVSSSVQLDVNGYTGAIIIGTNAAGQTTATFTVTNELGFAPGSTNLVTLVFTTSTGQKVTNSTSLVTPDWQTIPSSFAVTGINTSQVGFKVKPYLSVNGTTIASAEQELAGDNGTNKANLTQTIDGFPIDANGYYTWTNVINWDEVAVGTNGNHDGHFQPPAYPDLEFPGMPLVGEASSNLVSGDWNNLEEEVLTFVSFPSAGFYTMGVNSDDGFNLSVGPNPAKYGTNGPAVVLGDFDGGRGSSDSDFSFYVQAAGTYPFRLLYFNGGGGANCEWTSIDPSTGFRYLVNDPSPTNTTGIHAYYSTATVVTLPKFGAPVVAGGSITLTWTGTATLQQAPSLTGPWTDTTPAPTGNTFTTPIGSGDLFYRLKQ